MIIRDAEYYDAIEMEKMNVIENLLKNVIHGGGSQAMEELFDSSHNDECAQLATYSGISAI